ncbi:MAG: hypothetical protein JNM18_02000 [Planctomycetaceae bacterium]|nr:hypothetical protein [Planctomycetaceae bacterium]
MKPIDPQRIEVVDDAMVPVLRAMTIAQRLAIAFDCNETVRLRLAGHLQTRHPDWTPEQIAQEVARRMLNNSWDEYVPS